MSTVTIVVGCWIGALTLLIFGLLAHAALHWNDDQYDRRRPGPLPEETYRGFREPAGRRIESTVEAELLNTLSDIRSLPEVRT